jgi:hypothetical protein
MLTTKTPPQIKPPANAVGSDNLKQRVDEGRNGRTLCEQEESTYRHKGYDDWREPILLIVPHKLPKLGNNLYF